MKLGIPILVLYSVFFLVFSCNQVEFNSHSNSNTKHHQTKSECHLSTFSTTHNQNSLLLFILLLIALGSFLQKKSLKIKSILYKSPPRIFNIITFLFSKGILHPKLF